LHAFWHSFSFPVRIFFNFFILNAEEIAFLQIRLISTTEVKLRGLSGSCIYAYELTRTSSSSCSLPAKQSLNTPHAPDQTITDIQRSVHSSKLSFLIPEHTGRVPILYIIPVYIR
jgi:hypothetical protein